MMFVKNFGCVVVACLGLAGSLAAAPVPSMLQDFDGAGLSARGQPVWHLSFGRAYPPRRPAAPAGFELRFPARAGWSVFDTGTGPSGEGGLPAGLSGTPEPLVIATPASLPLTASSMLLLAGLALWRKRRRP